MDRPNTSPHQQVPMTRGNSAGISTHMEVQRNMVTRKLFAVLALMALMVTAIPGITLAQQPDLGFGTTPAGVNDACGGATEVHIDQLSVATDDPATALNEAGYRMIQVDGVWHQGFHRVDAQGNSVTQEFDAIFPSGTYLVYPDVRGTGWIYSDGCDPTSLVETHIQNRIADDADTYGSILPPNTEGLDVLFVRVGDVTTGPDLGTACGDAANPCTGTPITTQPGTTTVDPASVDMTVVLARANNDDRNPFERVAEGDCQVLAEYVGLDTEFATSGSHGIIGYPDELGQMRVTLTPHIRAATGGPIDATVRTLDVNCSFADALVEVQRFLQEHGLTTAALIDWKATGLFSEISRKAPFFGVGNGSGNERRCKAGLGREGLIQKHGARFGEPDAYVRLESWADGHGEYESWLEPGEYAERQPGVKGWYWTFDARYCSLAEIRADAQGQSDRRLEDEANNMGVVNDWRNHNLLRSWWHPAR